MEKPVRIIFFIFLTLVLLLAGAYFLFGKQFLGKKSKAQLAPTYMWEFNQDKQLEGWTGVGFSEAISVTGGNLFASIKNIKPTTVFPTLFSPFFKLDAKQFSQLQIRMKVVPEGSGGSTIISSANIVPSKTVTISSTFNNLNAKSDDWIALAKVGPEGMVSDDKTYVDWKWLNNTKTTQGAVTNGTITFENVPAGDYEIRYFTKNPAASWPWKKIESRKVTSAQVVVPPPTDAKPVSNYSVKGTLQLLFGPSNSDYSSPQSMKVETIEDSEFYTYTFNLQTNPEWKGAITQIKLVPTFNQPRTIFIDWMRFSAVETITPPPVKTELPVTEFGTIVEQSLIVSTTNLSTTGTKPIAPPPTKIPPKKTYSLKTDDGRIYPLTQTTSVVPPCDKDKPCPMTNQLLPQIDLSTFSGKAVFVEGTMKQNLLFKCEQGTNCLPPSITWWPLPNGLVFEVKRIQLAQKGQDTTVLGMPQGYIQNATAMYAGENVYVLVTKSVPVGITEQENKRILPMPPVQNVLYVRSSYADLSTLTGTLVSLKGQVFTVGTTQFMNVAVKGIVTTPPEKTVPLKK